MPVDYFIHCSACFIAGASWIYIQKRTKEKHNANPARLSTDPLLYDRLIRRFQTAQEREAEGRAKGFSGVLETDLLRSEAKIDAIANPDPNAMMSYTRGPDGEILAEDRDEIPPNKEEGERLWRWEMGLRFMQGNDIDFDYKTVDENDDLDDHTDEQDQYFEDEEPEWVVDSTRGDDARL